MFKLLLLIFSIRASHRFEQGLITHFSYLANPNLVLFLSSTQFRSEEFYIPFQKQFSQVPNVYLNIYKLDLSYVFPQGYSLEITSITTAGFKVKIICESTAQFFQVEFNWFAFNDDRVKVINNFNIINPQTQYIHSYEKNCYINIAFSNFVSYYALESQENYQTGLTLTPDTITISFSFQGLQSFGYQILLSNSDIFLIGPSIISIQPNGSSQVVNFPAGWITQNCFLNLLGFKHVGTINIRLFTQITYFSSVSVGIYPWADSIIYSIQYNYFCIHDIQFKLAKFDGFMQSQFFDPNNQIDTHIEIKEINYSQNQIYTEEIIIAQSIESITIIFYWQCLDQEILKIQLFCPEQWCSQTIIKCKIKKFIPSDYQQSFCSIKINCNSQQQLKPKFHYLQPKQQSQLMNMNKSYSNQKKQHELFNFLFQISLLFFYYQFEIQYYKIVNFEKDFTKYI
ncbi:unnamed protein product [Paramecium sonneborni]|uniref:H-type lectin domain-containing protein n=1 Tax=Paramecium sonneborni TaxID=65129 RepID=A0A8S1R4M1_9CILI|nr:unnamed protein product [Paramecium sonneborni]